MVAAGDGGRSGDKEAIYTISAGYGCSGGASGAANRAGRVELRGRRGRLGECCLAPQTVRAGSL